MAAGVRLMAAGVRLFAVAQLPSASVSSGTVSHTSRTLPGPKKGCAPMCVMLQLMVCWGVAEQGGGVG